MLHLYQPISGLVGCPQNRGKIKHRRERHETGGACERNGSAFERRHGPPPLLPFATASTPSAAMSTEVEPRMMCGIAASPPRSAKGSGEAKRRGRREGTAVLGESRRG